MNKPWNNSQLPQLTISLFREVIREPEVIFWGIVFPILMALGLGVAFTQKPDLTRSVALVGLSGTSETLPGKMSRALENKDISWSISQNPQPVFSFTLENRKTGKITYRLLPTTWEAAMVLLKRGNINLILEQKNDSLYYHFDPLNPEAQLIYLQLSGILEPGNRPVQQNLEQIAPLTVTGTRYIDFLVPGLLAMGIMMSCMWGISYNLIDKRTKKLLRRMIATPMKKRNLLIALITVRVAMNLIESGLLFLFVYIFFSITIQGDLLALGAVFMAGNLCFSGIAIFVSSRTANTEIGNGLINAVVLPMMVLSGIFFSYHNFPDWAVPVIQRLPLTLLADATRSIFIEGAGIPETVLATVLMSVIGLGFFFAGLRIFKWY